MQEKEKAEKVVAAAAVEVEEVKAEKVVVVAAVVVGVEEEGGMKF